MPGLSGALQGLSILPKDIRSLLGPWQRTTRGPLRGLSVLLMLHWKNHKLPGGARDFLIHEKPGGSRLNTDLCVFSWVKSLALSRKQGQRFRDRLIWRPATSQENRRAWRRSCRAPSTTPYFSTIGS